MISVADLVDLNSNNGGVGGIIMKCTDISPDIYKVANTHSARSG